MRILLVVAMFCSIIANAQEPSSYASFSKSFRCPEELPSDQDRQKDLQRFLNWANERYSGLTVSKITDLRLKLLKEHRCEATLKNIRENSHSVSNADTRAICKADNGEKFFSSELAKNCAPILLERGWTNFHSGSKLLVDIMPSKIVKESDGAKVWTQTFIAEPIPFNNSKLNYDSAKGITKFYCKTRQQRLIQATYHLNERLIYERTSSESVMEEIEPGTIADDLYAYVCRK